ncbi:MAG: hypothetical protein Q9179_007162, partial [Wetmoreana sp. 5 TL-2023]
MAEANPSASFEPTAQTSSTPERPVKRIPFKDRLKLLREQQYETTKRSNEAARASNFNQFQTRMSASPRRVVNDSMMAATPTQASSPHVPSGSLPANRPLADSRGTAPPSQGSSPQVEPDSLPSSRPPPESRPAVFPGQIPSPHTPPSLLPTTRALQESRLAANASQGPFRQVQPGSTPANSPMEPRPLSSHPTKSQTPFRVAGHSLEQQQPPTAPQQPLIPQQPQVLVNPDQQFRHMAPPVAVPVEVPLVVRTSQEGQHMPVEPNFAPYYPASSYPPRNDSLKPYKLTPNEHTISLAMNVRVRDQYVGIIRMYQRAIMELMHSEAPSEECLQEIQKLRDRVDKITTHSDLDAREIPEDPTQTSPSDEARWAENCSFKFQFLRHFLDHIRNNDMHVGIVARPGRSLDIIETYLKGRGIAYFRPDGKGASLPNDPRFAQCKCQVSIVPSGPEGMNLAVKRASLVIAFDASVNVQEPQVHRMRIREGCDWLMPLAHLLVYKSAEHITRCLPLQMEPMNWLRKIVSCMTQVRHEVGVLQPEDCDVIVAGQEAGISLELGGQERRWTLPEIRPISLGFLESSRDSSTQEDSQSSQSQEGAIQSSALKRTWDPDAANSDMMKRQRMSPAGNVSHVSNSTIQSSPMDQMQQQNVYLLHENASLKTQIHQLTTSLNAIKDELATRTRNNQDLQFQITNQQNHMADLEKSLSDLQSRYEDKHRAHLRAHHEKSTLISSRENAERRLEAQTNDFTALRESKRALEQALENARKDLLNTSNPDLNRLAVAENNARTADAEAAKLKENVASLTAQLRDIRQAYHSASSSAADFSAEISTLTNRITGLEQKASGEATRLAQINKDNAIEEARKEIRGLKHALEEREK